MALVFKCDKCGKIDETHGPKVFRVKFTVMVQGFRDTSTGTTYVASTPYGRHHEETWCVACAEAKGFNAECAAKSTPDASTPSERLAELFEEMIDGRLAACGGD